jgi:hypothetical protein
VVPPVWLELEVVDEPGRLLNRRVWRRQLELLGDLDFRDSWDPFQVPQLRLLDAPTDHPDRAEEPVDVHTQPGEVVGYPLDLAGVLIVDRDQNLDPIVG